MDYANTSDVQNVQLINKFDEQKFKDFSQNVFKELEDFKIQGKSQKLTKKSIDRNPSKAVTILSRKLVSF